MLRRLESSPSALSLALGLLRPRRRPPADASPPTLALEVERVPIEPAPLASWRAACGFDAGESVPLSYLFVRAYYAQAALLLHRSFPLQPLGMVHIGSQIEQLGEIHAGDALSLHLTLLGWRQVRRGREVDVEVRYSKDGAPVARAVQTSLGRGGGTGERKAAVERPGPPGGPYETWSLDPATGRRYAKISGDWNPIHLWPLTARAFGYRRPIAHGMYLVARAEAALDPGGERARRLDVRFKTPAELPGEVRFYRRTGGFELWRGDGSRPHVVANVESG